MECLNCKKSIDNKKKFCSSSCSATYNNKLRAKRSEESRLNTSTAMKNSQKAKNSCLPENIKKRTEKSNQTRLLNGTSAKKEKELICTICKKKFLSIKKPSGHFPTLCSDECYLKMKKSNSTGIKRHHYKGLQFDSKWEIKIAEYLDEKNIIWIQPKTAIEWIDKRNKKRKYFPDFYLPDYNLYLDPKNPFIIQLQQEKLSYISTRINLFYGNLSEILNKIKNLVEHRID